MKITLLISTYNWPEALNLVLKSALQQTQLPNEILIADDGSSPETKQLIDEFIINSKIKINHVWHEDKGFRRSAILNKAIATTNTDYIIQVDGDCILNKNFIKDHTEFAKKKQYLFGSRVNIQQKFLNELFIEKIINFNIFSGGIKKRTRTLRIPFLANFYNSSSELSNKLRGCNLSFFREDFIAVNGYNEDLEGWGKEDSELAVRLLNNGCKGKRIRYKGIVYHIWHSEQSKNRLSKNESIQAYSLKNKISRCKNGIDKYF